MFKSARFLIACMAFFCTGCIKSEIPAAIVAAKPYSLSADSDQCAVSKLSLLLISSDNNYLAYNNTSNSDTYILNAVNKKGYVVSNLSPMTWESGARTLWLTDKSGDIWRWKDNQIAKDLTANAGLLRFDWSRAIGKAGYHFYNADHGIALFTSPALDSLIAVNLGTGKTFRVNVGAGPNEASHSLSAAYVGWNTETQQPAVFVAHQILKPKTENSDVKAVIENNIEVYDRGGNKLFSSKIGGLETSFLGVFNGHGVYTALRGENYRCVYHLNAVGNISQVGDCASDIDAAYPDKNGSLLGTQNYHDFDSEFSDPALKSEAAFLSEDGKRHVRYLNNAPGLSDTFEVIGDAGDREIINIHNDSKNWSLNLTPDACGAHEIEFGSPITTRSGDGRSGDGLSISGYLFKPAGRIHGIIAFLHGGPYQSTQSSSHLFPALTSRGYAVIDVGYRGTPGYGRATLEAGFHAPYQKIVEDAVALKREALKELGLSSHTPAYVYGMSYGGYIAIDALLTSDDFSGGIVHSGICEPSITRDDAIPWPGRKKTNMATLTDPARAYYQLLLVTDQRERPLDLSLCATSVPTSKRIVVIHAEDDNHAPISEINGFIANQNPSNMLPIVYKVGGHFVAQDTSTFPADKILQFLTNDPPSKPPGSVK